MKHLSSRLIARITAFALILLLAMGIWAQKKGHFAPADKPMAFGSSLNIDR